MKSFTTSAPGRVCLYGEHQDYLGLPVIPAAITMRTTMNCKETGGDAIHVNAMDLGKRMELPTGGDLTGALKDPDLSYFAAIVKAFEDTGTGREIQGFTCDVTSEIPIKSGLSSSAALLVAFAKAVDTVAGAGLGPQEIGWLAYRAEHDVLGIPCGMMDQLSSAMGNVIHLTCSTPPAIEPLEVKLEGLVVADTKIHKSTNNVHTVRVQETNDGLDKLGKMIEFDIATTPWDTLEPFIDGLDETSRNRLTAVFKDRDITAEALGLLREAARTGVPDYPRLGKLLLEHQAYLRDYFEVSVDKIEAIIDAAVEAGAIGGKLTGAGMGGSVVILAPGKEDAVAKAIERVDGVPYIVSVDGGVK